MLTIYKTYDTNIEDIGPIEFLHQSICFTKIMERVKELNALVVILKPFIDLENRGGYIITGFNTEKNFFEIKTILELNIKNKKFKNYKTWLFNTQNFHHQKN